MKLPRIFVHIPSYRDRECQWTLKDMYEKARHPERVFAGVCWQTLPEEDGDCFVVEPRPEQVRSVHFHIRDARGLGWARQQAQTLWQGEEYSLQIDSHMRFVPGWDEEMLDMLAACEAPEPVLTCYPPGYLPPNNLIERNDSYVQAVKRFQSNGLLEFFCLPAPAGLSITRPMPTAACAGGFIFGPSRILRDVPSDPEIYFNGEEPNLAVRLWTHGFDLYSPQRPLIYHYYGRHDSSRHWNDSKPKAWTELHRRTLVRMKALLEPAASPPEEVSALGVYGLGARRSLAEYEDFSGVRFTGKTLASYARTFPGIRVGAKDYGVTLEDSLILEPQAHLFMLDDEGLLFSVAMGAFYRLNPSATYVWCSLEEGLTWSAIAAELAAVRGISTAEATHELTQLATHWLGQGILCRAGAKPMQSAAPDALPQPDRNQYAPPHFDPARFDFRQRLYSLLGVTIRVRYGNAKQEACFHPVLAHLETKADSPAAQTLTVAHIVRDHYLYSDDKFIYTSETISELAPRLKFEVLCGAIRQHDHILHLHAGAVSRDGFLVLMPAGSGSGKTSLTARLIAAGCEYFSDETVLLERDSGWVRPVPLSLCIKESGVALLDTYFPGLAELPSHLREDGELVRYLSPPKSSLPADISARPAKLLVFPRYIEGAPTVLRKLSAAEAFGRLLDECVAIPEQLGLTDAAVLVRTVEGMRCFTLTGGDLDAAAETILDLCQYSSD